MARVVIDIHDVDVKNVGVNVDVNPPLPNSAMLYTNAQAISAELIALLQKLASSINDKNNKLVL